MSEKLNVCLLNDSFPPLIDGVATTVINYASIIQKELGSATVVTPAYPGAEDNYDFPVVRYSSLSTEKSLGYRAGYPFSASTLEAMKNCMFNIIHSHCPFASTVFARNLKEKNGAPLIMTYHTKFDEDIKVNVKLTLKGDITPDKADISVTVLQNENKRISIRKSDKTYKDFDFTSAEQ
ncbi:MAG: glycosyltransferase, partial [Ruminiclostridium sp.]|nr:glycosyltransferase [Ruminiclostridium sp.]